MLFLPLALRLVPLLICYQPRATSFSALRLKSRPAGRSLSAAVLKSRVARRPFPLKQRGPPAFRLFPISYACPVKPEKCFTGELRAISFELQESQEWVSKRIL